MNVKLTLRTALTAAAAAIAGAFILGRPEAASAAVRAAAEGCLDVIVPSLFAFTVLAVFLRDSGLYRVVLKPLALPMSRLLRMDEELCAYIVLGNIGGYPVGAKLLSQAVDERRITAQDAGRLLCCCFGSGPSFVIGIAGMRVFGSAAVGGAIFAACFMSSLVMAAVVRARGKITLHGERSAPQPSAQCLVGSMMSGARVMFTVCAMITAFAAVTALLDAVGALRLAQAAFERVGAGEDAGRILPALLEVSRTGELSGEGFASVPLCAGLLSFGGVCVLLQVAAVAGNIPLKRFLLTRPLAAAMSAAFALPAGLIPRAAAAAVPAGSVAYPFTAGAASSVCVLVMCGILLSGEDKSRR